MIIKSRLILSAAILLCACAPEAPPASETAIYNGALAAELGADDYGMRSYVMGVLKTGPMDDKITDKDKRAEIFKGHFANMGRLAEEKKLVLAGPFIEGGEKRGLYIFNVATIAEAEALVQSDPAVAAGIFVPELTKYYGSAALMQIQDVHQTLQKEKIE